MYLPEFFVSNVVSDDVPVALLLVGLVPHHVQLGRGQCTDPDVFRASFRPLSVCYELQRDKTLRPEQHCTVRDTLRETLLLILKLCW